MCGQGTSPIHVVSGADHTQTALSLGAVGYKLKPVKHEQLADVLNRLEAKLAQRMHRVLIVEDDERQREAVSKLLTSEDTQTIAAAPPRSVWTCSAPKHSTAWYWIFPCPTPLAIPCWKH
jgi:CheY-like chemotaxis protein